MSSTLRELLGIDKEAARRRPKETFGPQMPTEHQFPAEWKVPNDPMRQQELFLWQQWTQSGHDPQHLEPLMGSLQPLINKQVRVFTRGVPVPESVLQSVANDHTAMALKKFDPSRAGGAALHSWVTTNLKGLNRYVGKNQNFARITEDRNQLFGDYRRAKTQLADELGREPTHFEISQRINESPDRQDRRRVTAKTVKLLGQEQKDDLLASAAVDDPFVQESPRLREAMGLVRYEMDPDELQVWEYIRGLSGKPRLHRTIDIASKLGWSQSKVSLVKGRINDKLRDYLED